MGLQLSADNKDLLFFVLGIAVACFFTCFRQVKYNDRILFCKVLHICILNFRFDIFKHGVAIGNFKNRVLQPKTKLGKILRKLRAHFIITDVIAD